MKLSNRKPPPRHAMPAPPPGSVRTKRHGQDFSTTIMLVVVLVLTSAFVAGTTATFTASTTNAGKFTVAGLGKPTTPTMSLAGTTATFGWTPATAGADYNVNIGYRILRKGVGGPTTTGGAAPDCTAGSYSTLDYTQAGSYADATIPSAAADQGEYYCYGAEGVFPCCPSVGKIPVITSLQGRIQIAVQTGFVVSTYTFSGTANQLLANGEKLVVNFNQPVNTATSVLAADSLCVDPTNKVIRIGMASTAVDTCMNTTNEVQRLTFSATPGGSKTFTISFNGSTTANITGATDMTSNIQTALNTTFGAGQITVTRNSSTQYDFTFKGANVGNVGNMTATNFQSGNTPTVTRSDVTTGVAAETYEAQRLVFSATPTGTQSFTITYNGATTAAITGGTTINAGIQSALEALSTVGTGGVTVTRTSATQYELVFAGKNTGNLPQVTATNFVTGGPTVTPSTVTAGVAASDFGYLSNTGTWSGPASRWDITSATWSNGNKTVTITLGNNLGTNTTTIPTGTWTFNPTTVSAKSTSATGALAICSLDPAGSPTGGLCRPTATGGW